MLKMRIQLSQFKFEQFKTKFIIATKLLCVNTLQRIKAIFQKKRHVYGKINTDYQNDLVTASDMLGEKVKNQETDE